MASKNGIVFWYFSTADSVFGKNSPFFLWDHARWDVCGPFFSEKDDSLKTNRQQSPWKTLNRLKSPISRAKTVPGPLARFNCCFPLINSFFLIPNTCKREMKQNIVEFHMQTFFCRKRYGFEEHFLLIFLREYCCHVKMRESSKKNSTVVKYQASLFYDKNVCFWKT